MQDADKTTDQLRAEVEALRQQVAMLQKLVAEHQQLAEVRQASEARYRILVENLNDVLYSIDLSGRILYISPAIERLSGYQPSELIGRSFPEFLHPDDLPAIVEQFRYAVAGNAQPDEYRILTKGGETRWVRSFSYLSAGEAQEVKLNGMLVDIDKRKKAEEALRASEQKYRDLYDSLLDGVVRASPDNCIIDCNRAFADMLGYSQEELRGRHCSTLTPACWRALETQILTEQVFTRGYSDEYEKEFVRRDGALVPVSMKIWRTVKAQGEMDGIWGIVRDLTAAKQAEREREALHQLAHNLTHATDLQSATAALFQQVRACFGATYGSVTLVDGAGEVLHEVSSYGMAEAGGSYLASRNVRWETSPAAMAFRTRQPVIIENFPQSPCVNLRLREQYSFLRDIWVVPLMGGGEAVGTLLLGFATRRETTAAEVRLLQLLGDEAALALQRARFAEEVQQSRAQYETLLNSVDGIVWEVDLPTFQFTFVSQQAKQLLGYPVEQWLTEPDFWQHHMHPEDREWAINFCLTATQQKLPHQFDYRMLATDGRVVWVRDQVRIIIENDRPVALRGIMTDITAQKQAEEALRESEARWQFALEGSGDGVWDWNVQTNQVFFSPRWKAMLGYTEQDEMSNMLDEWEKRLHPDDRAQTYEALERHFRRETPQYVSEFRMRCKNGSYKWILDRGKVLTWTNDGKPLRMVGTHTDITERKRMEDALREREERFHRFMDNSPAIAYMKDEAGRYVYMSQSFERSFSLRPGEWIGKTDFDLWPAVAPPLQAHDAIVLAEHKTLEIRETTQLDGDIRQWLSFKFPFTDEAGRRLVGGVSVDITDRIRAEEERHQLQAQLFQAQKLEAIGTLASGVAHDFNNILTAIMGFAELTVNEMPEGTEAQDNLREILVASHRAKTVVRQLLHFSRSQASEWQIVNLPTIVQDTVQLLRAMILPTVQLSARLDCRKGTIWGDPVQLQQVLMNLCINAAYALGEHGGKIEIDLQEVTWNRVGAPPALSHDRSLRLTVRDTGCGMPPDMLERIFEPFFTTKPVGEGSGLGLAVVHGIVTDHGGTITVESQPGEGTIFHIYFPWVGAEPDTQSADTRASIV